jgi:TRAP transporter TAXI family solute receptor
MIARMSMRDWWKYATPVLLLALLVLVVSVVWLRPAPPDRLVIATAGADGAYSQFAARYREFMAERGVTLDIVHTAGSVDNLARLRQSDGGVQAALVQGGLGYLTLGGPRRGDENLTLVRSLATVSYEPVWIFTRNPARDSLLDLRQLRVAIGPEGSGTRKVAIDLLADAGVAHRELILLDLAGRAAAEAFQANAIDALIGVAAAEAPYLQPLLRDPDAALVSLSNSAALVRRIPYLQPILFPQGVVDIKANLPPRDVTLLATTANLVVRDDLHPTLQYLLIEAAMATHGGPGLLHRPGDFPNSKATDFPLSEEAKRYHRDGRPFFHRYLPYRLAVWCERLLVVLLPLAVVVGLLLRAIPSFARWRTDNKLYRWYGQLMAMERDLFARELGPGDVPRHIAALNQMERDAEALRLPLEYSDRLYTLRQHIDYVRARLNNVQVGSHPGSR